MNSDRNILTLRALACALALLAAACGQKPQSTADAPTEKATVGDLRVEITGRGELRALVSHEVRIPMLRGRWHRLKVTNLIKE